MGHRLRILPVTIVRHFRFRRCCRAEPAFLIPLFDLGAITVTRLWNQLLAASAKSKKQRRPRTFQGACESLEERRLMAEEEVL